MSDVIHDKTDAEVVAELRANANDERLEAGLRYLLTTAANRLEWANQRAQPSGHSPRD